jgi:hypothetical protein
MSKNLKFEFDFDEVFEGIKLGVIKEMSEMTFDDITSSAINQVKTEMKNKISLTYKDEYELRDDIKKEIKEKVYQKLITDIKNEYKKNYEEAFSRDITKSFNSVEEDVMSDIKSETIDKLYNDLYSSIQSQVKSKINNSISELINAITGNGINTKNTISKEEYDELIHRDEILTALENGGVDNWEWYGESLSNYFDRKNK